MRKILLVEDDPIFTQLITRIVGDLNKGFIVEATESGNDAINKISSGDQYELALVDLGLPDISGIEVIRQIAKNQPSTPTLVISVISSEESLISSIQSGARGYILKDDSEDAMKLAITQVLQGNYPISPMLARHLFKLVSATSTPNKDKFLELTPKELEVLSNISHGKSYEETANAMKVSLSTVQTHIRSLYRKLNVHSQAQAVKEALDRGLV